MFNPSELQGEVDHSFFDSDCDDSGDKGERGAKKSTAKKQNPTNPTGHRVADASPKTERTGKYTKQVEIYKKRRASSASSVSSELDKAISDGSDSGNDSYLLSKTLGGTNTDLLFDTQEAGDVSNKTLGEMEKNAFATRRRNRRSSRKLAGNWHAQSPSPTSTEFSDDTDSDSSCSSTDSDVESYSLPQTPSSSSHSRGRRVGSPASLKLTSTCTDDSDDTITDVSPLSSPESSTWQSPRLNQTELDEESHQQVHQQQESSPPGGNAIQQAGDSYQDMDEVSVSLGSELDHKLVFPCAGGRNRRNYSFSNDEVQRIDRENQRLLRQLSRLSPRPRTGSGVGKRTQVASNLAPSRLSHSAVNRQRDHQRIERENLALLKRLESVKSTPGTRRSEQLADYHRLGRYPKGPVYPVYGSLTETERSSSRASLGPRFISSRAASVSTNSSSTPVPRTSKLNAARPAWC